jgi:hypothetical protein
VATRYRNSSSGASENRTPVEPPCDRSDALERGAEMDDPVVGPSSPCSILPRTVHHRPLGRGAPRVSTRAHARRSEKETDCIKPGSRFIAAFEPSHRKSGGRRLRTGFSHRLVRKIPRASGLDGPIHAPVARVWSYLHERRTPQDLRSPGEGTALGPPVETALHPTSGGGPPTPS